MISHPDNVSSASSGTPLGVSIVAAQLSKRFNREWIFKQLSFHFKAGNKYVITGPNGSGKSTFLQVLSGHIPPSGGSIRYETADGKDIAVDEIYQSLSVAAPYMDLIDEFTLMEQLQFHFKLKKIRNHFSIGNVLKIMYLENARDKFLSNFSTGMKQRVKLALAFYSDTPLVILDEPGTNLDSQAFVWYRTELDKLPADCTVLIASNNPMEYPQNCEILNISDFKM